MSQSLCVSLKRYALCVFLLSSLKSDTLLIKCSYDCNYLHWQSLLYSAENHIWWGPCFVSKLLCRHRFSAQSDPLGSECLILLQTGSRWSLLEARDCLTRIQNCTLCFCIARQMTAGWTDCCWGGACVYNIVKQCMHSFHNSSL